MSKSRTNSARVVIEPAGKNPSPEEYEKNMAAYLGLPVEEVEYDPDSRLLWYKGKFCLETGLLIEPYLLPQSLPESERPSTKKPVKIIRHPFKNFADIAELTRSWRNPKCEKLRHLYVKDGVIIDYEKAARHGLVRGLPTTGYTREEVKHINERIDALCADSVFIIHNHYSAYSSPSAIEIEPAAIYIHMVPKLKAHIIINPAWFCLITLKGVAILRVLADCRIEAPGINRALPQTYRTQLDAEPKIVAWTKVLTERDIPVLIGLRDEYGLRTLQKICLHDIDNWNKVVDIMAQDPEDYEDEDPLVLKKRAEALEVAQPLLRHGVFIRF